MDLGWSIKKKLFLFLNIRAVDRESTFSCIFAMSSSKMSISSSVACFWQQTLSYSLSSSEFLSVSLITTSHTFHLLTRFNIKLYLSKCLCSPNNWFSEMFFISIRLRIRSSLWSLIFPFTSNPVDLICFPCKTFRKALVMTVLKRSSKAQDILLCHRSLFDLSPASTNVTLSCYLTTHCPRIK